MISVEKEHIHINGSEGEVLTDISMIIHCVHEFLTEEMGEDIETAREMISYSVSLGFEDEDKVQEQADKATHIQKLVNDLYEGV